MERMEMLFKKGLDELCSQMAGCKGCPFCHDVDCDDLTYTEAGMKAIVSTLGKEVTL